MNYVDKLCLTGLPLAEWCNEISNTAADSWNTNHNMHMPINKYSWSVLNALAVVGKTHAWLSAVFNTIIDTTTCHNNVSQSVVDKSTQVCILVSTLVSTNPG